MTDTNERELQAFDEALAPLYKETVIAPPNRLDDAIKAKARRAVSSGPAALGTDKEKSNVRWFRRREIWQVPLSLAAGLMLGILIIPATQQTDTTGISSSEMVFMGDKHTDSEEVTSLENQPPEEWIRTIAGLLLQGESRKAEVLLSEFNRRFPDYSSTKTGQ